MPNIGTGEITCDTDPSTFLQASATSEAKSKINQIAKKLNNAKEIIEKEKTSGLSRDAFIEDGSVPLATEASKLSLNIETQISNLNSLAAKLDSAREAHYNSEVEEFNKAVNEKISQLKNSLATASDENKQSIQNQINRYNNSKI